MPVLGQGDMKSSADGEWNLPIYSLDTVQYLLDRNIIWLPSALGKMVDVRSLRFFVYIYICVCMYVCIYVMAQLQLLYRHFQFLNNLLPF